MLYIEQPDMPENPKLLKLSMLGAPNAGKSTLVNRIMNKRVSLKKIYFKNYESVIIIQIC